jgi:adenylosuccinate synthase
MKCNNLFDKGKLTILLDGGAGSSGKGKIASFVAENADNWQFACNTFHPQAGHWVKLADGRSFFYQSLNSCAYLVDKYEKIYLGPGAMIELPALLREIEENKIPAHKLGISPVVPILDEYLDQGFERGTLGFDGAERQDAMGTARFGSTAHGVGSCNARRILRRPSMRLARDVPELAPYICDVPAEIRARLDAGQSGLLELAQGYQLSLMHSYFYPYTTSRNVTVAQGLSDMFLPIKYAGKTIINFRTFPIRINSNKYVSKIDGHHCTWAEVQAGHPHEVLRGDSGRWYPDQTELTWEELTALSGSKEPIAEITSVTKLPRRVATFSKENLVEAVRDNDTGHGVVLSLNFCNYVDDRMSGLVHEEDVTVKFADWLLENVPADYRRMLQFLGTGALTEQTIHLER